VNKRLESWGSLSVLGHSRSIQLGLAMSDHSSEADIGTAAFISTRPGLSAFTFLTPLCGVTAGHLVLNEPLTPPFAIAVLLVAADLGPRKPATMRLYQRCPFTP
jgi:hypothetical protein